MAEIVGASLTALTVNENVSALDNDPSETVKVTVVAPLVVVLALATGVSVAEQFGAVPEIEIPPLAKTLVLLEVPVTEPAQVSVESASVIVKLKLEETVSSLVDFAVISEMAGASFTPVTVNVKASLAVKEPSVTVKVTVLDPEVAAEGVIVTVQLGAVPPKTIPDVGRRVVLEDALDMEVEQFKLESTSLIVKLMAPVFPFSAMV